MTLGDALITYWNINNSAKYSEIRRLIKVVKNPPSRGTMLVSELRYYENNISEFEELLKKCIDVFVRAGTKIADHKIKYKEAYRHEIHYLEFEWDYKQYYANTSDPEEYPNYTHNQAIMEGTYIDSQYRNGAFPKRVRFMFKEELEDEPTDEEISQIERNLAIFDDQNEKPIKTNNMDQTSCFTTEQMKGTGQTNMLDLIDKNKTRVRELKRTPHTFWRDPGHGWLEVKFSDIIVLNLMGAISGYSYRDDDKVYLEEDMDAELYIHALFGHYATRNETQKYEFELWRDQVEDQYKENIFIRNLKHF